MNLPVICALLACLSYVLFSRCYEPAVRGVNDPRIAAIILYALAGTVLLLTAGTARLFHGQSDALPNTTTFFGMPLTSEQIVWALVAGVVAMTMLYTIHIETEAKSRRKINMGVYSVIFQLNVFVVAGLDSFLFRPAIVPSALMGSVMIFAASCGGLALHAYSIGTQYKSFFRSTIMWSAIISAVSCGLALLVDGEVVRNFVLSAGLDGRSLASFLLYEALTFLLPSISLLLYLRLAGKNDQIYSFLLLDVFRAPGKFFLAALFSASQFVFSVLALAIPGPRFVPAAVLAIAPFLCVLADSNKRSTVMVLGEAVCAILAAIGIVMVVE